MLGLLFFSSLALILVGAAIGVITSRNPVYSALFLVLAFVTSAFLWMLLEAEFLAIVLVLVYVGAVMVLFLFVVMMIDINVEQMKEGFTKYAPLGALIAFLMAAELISVFWVRNSGLPVLANPPPHPPGYSNTKELGSILYTDYVYAFELAAFILLLAIVAAIVLTMRRRPGLKTQDISAQVSVSSKDRVRLVKMEAESD
jgi:NADH-quinone oxidoreductase subunit J